MFTVFTLSHRIQCSLCDGTVGVTVTYAVLVMPLNVKDGIMIHLSGPNQGHAENFVSAKLKNNQGLMLLEAFAHSLTSLSHSVALLVQMRQCL